MKIKHQDIERGFAAGIQVFHQLSKNWHDRVAFGKLSRRIEREFKEVTEEWASIVKEFANKDGGVSEELMDKKTLTEWKSAAKAWREREIEFTFDPAQPDAKLPVKLGAISLRSIPFNIMESVVDYVEFSEDANQTKEEDTEARINKLQEELDKLKKKAG